MQLLDSEYSINNDSITISREALEHWRSHYLSVSQSRLNYETSQHDPIGWIYAGKADVLTEILKHFDYDR